MKILIIGSNGFLGSNFIRFFSEKKITIFGCDVVKEAKEKYFYVDASAPNYDEIFKNNQFDVCINASGSANVSFSFQNPQADFQSNVNNVFLLLNAIVKYNPSCKFVNLSSAAIYGNPQKLPISEADLAMPMSPYGFHKQMAEILVQEFSKLYKLSSCSVRIFSAYGPGLRKQLFWDIYQKTKEQDEIQLFGTGKETRDFIFVDDVIKITELLINKADFTGEIYNIGCGKETTIEEAARIFLNIINPSLKLSFNNQVKQGDPIRWRADISKINNLKDNIGIETNLTDGLAEYYKWIKNNNL